VRAKRGMKKKTPFCVHDHGRKGCLEDVKRALHLNTGRGRTYVTVHGNVTGNNDLKCNTERQSRCLSSSLNAVTSVTNQRCLRGVRRFDVPSQAPHAPALTLMMAYASFSPVTLNNTLPLPGLLTTTACANFSSVMSGNLFL